MKKKLSFKQWAGAILVLLLFILLTLFLYGYFHEDSRFEKFAMQFFVNELSSNPINLHYTLTDPSVYGIDESSMTLPIYHAGQALENWDSIQETLSRLKKFHPERLSSSNQYTYILFTTYLENRKACAAYPYYEEPLSPVSGIQSELPVLLADYRLASTTDIQNYLSILSQIPSYLEGVLLYEREKIEYDLFMPDTAVDKVIEQCELLMNKDELEAGSHFLEITFAERLSKLVEQNTITAEQSRSYQEENKRLLTTVVAPAYDKMADELTLLKGSGCNDQGLCYHIDGRDYYQAYLRQTTGSYRTVPEIKSLLAKDFEQNYAALVALLRQYPALADSLSAEASPFPALTPEDMLSLLQTMISQDYPAIPADADQTPQCSVKYVDECLAPYSAPAFYLTPPLDNMRENTIYINRLDTAEGLSLFTTLAHEGYPGHLYQNVYYAASNPAPIRSLLGCGGYTEGWATYTEMMSYYTTGLSTEQATLLQRNASVLLGIYALADMGIHYEGWTLIDTVSFFHQYGISDTTVIEDIYDLIIADPANYLKYYIGYVEFLELKKEAIEKWGKDFTQKRFHKAVLDAGPMPFYLLRDTIFRQ